MWIKLNGMPLDTSKIIKVSSVIELSTPFMNNFNDKELHSLFYKKLSVEDRTHFLQSMKRSAEYLAKHEPKVIEKHNSHSLADIREITSHDPDPRTYGYCFYIEYREQYQSFLNHSYNGLRERTQYILSKIYTDASEVTETLDKVLTQLNKVITDLPEINM